MKTFGGRLEILQGSLIHAVETELKNAGTRQKGAKEQTKRMTS
jgi:hypothetical protein